MKRGKEFLLDCLKVFAVGLAAAAVIALLLLGGGALFGKHGIASGMEAVKDGLLLILALALFLLAGMLMTKGKKPERFFADNGWRRHFSVIGPKTALCVLCIPLLALAALVDYLLMF